MERRSDSYDDLVLPFIFVPHGQPESPEVAEYKARYPDWFSIPATFVPHAGGRSDLAGFEDRDDEARDGSTDDRGSVRVGQVGAPDFAASVHAFRAAYAVLDNPGAALRNRGVFGAARKPAPTDSTPATPPRADIATATRGPDSTSAARILSDPGAVVLIDTPNTGAPNSWYANPGSGQMRFYGPDGLPGLDIDSDHDHGAGSPHMHIWMPRPGAYPMRGPGIAMPPDF